ncbi:hypothetical protein BDZ89DRAFT_1146133 [Hymenopellis radicata]|nr:hypothetical protein BDZ89DRAFT_1146133 [Hymenopellis radicata]
MTKLSVEELHDSDVTPCGDDCFKHQDMDSYEVKGESDIDKDQFIIGVLQIDLDILPCDLSFTSKVACGKIFLYHARFLSQADKRPDNYVYGFGLIRVLNAEEAIANRQDT